MKLIFLALIILIFVVPPVFAQNEDKIIVFHTPQGHLAFELFPDYAPNHVEKILHLADIGFYDGTAFHRVIKNFMIQGGDPTTKQNNDIDPGSTLMAEFNTIKHDRGIVSAARTNDPNSARNQFFIVHNNSNFLDGQYTVFGRLVTQESFETLDKIANLATSPRDRPLDIEQARITKTEILNRNEMSNLLKLDAPAGALPKVAQAQQEKTQKEDVMETQSGASSAITETKDSDGEGGGCLIATAAYGSELSSQVQQLRELRDNTLLQTKSGTAFIEGFNQFYYSFSPLVADLQRDNPIFRESVKLSITPLISTLSLLNYVDINSEAKVLGYGVSLILLNIGVYFIAPLIVISNIKKHFKN